MRPLDRKQKVLRFIALAALGLLLAPFVAVQVQERIFRHRAERLLADMRSLMLRKATMAEIEAVFKRWNPHGDPCFGELGYFYGHPRSGQGCNLAADSWSPSFDKNPEGAENYWSGLWRLLFVIGGGRDAHIRAYAIVEGGDVKSLWFRVDVDLSLAHIDGYRLPATLSGSVVTIPRFSVSDVLARFDPPSELPHGPKSSRGRALPQRGGERGVWPPCQPCGYCSVDKL